MAKISELTDGGNLLSTDYLIVVRSGANVRARMVQAGGSNNLADDQFINLGDDQDLTIVHTPAESIIDQAGTGDLLIQKAGVTKLTINSTGIDVMGRADFGENGTATNSSDPVVNVNRTVDDTGFAGSGHCFSDSSTVTRAGGISYASYDCRINVSGTEGYGHFAPFQNGLVYNSTGTTGILYGYVDVPSVTNGTVTTRYGIKINDVVTSGSGSVTNNYAIWIDQQTAAGTSKWGLVQKGTSKNLFEGPVTFQAAITLNDTVIDDSASAGTRIGVGAGSAYDLSIMKADYSAFIMTVPANTNKTKFWGGLVSAGLADGSVYTLESDQSLYGTGTIGHIVFRNGTGIAGQIQTSGSTTNYVTSSDYRLKTDIKPMQNSIERLLALEPVNFQWIESGDRVDGFIAHHAALVVPEAVSGEKDAMRTEIVKDEDDVPIGEIQVPDYQGIDQSKLVPLLTKALQEAISKIDALEARVAALEIGG